MLGLLYFWPINQGGQALHAFWPYRLITGIKFYDYLWHLIAILSKKSHFLFIIQLFLPPVLGLVSSSYLLPVHWESRLWKIQANVQQKTTVNFTCCYLSLGFSINISAYNTPCGNHKVAWITRIRIISKAWSYRWFSDDIIGQVSQIAVIFITNTSPLTMQPFGIGFLSAS